MMYNLLGYSDKRPIDPRALWQEQEAMVEGGHSSPTGAPEPPVPGALPRVCCWRGPHCV